MAVHPGNDLRGYNRSYRGGVLIFPEKINSLVRLVSVRMKIEVRRPYIVIHSSETICFKKSESGAPGKL